MSEEKIEPRVYDKTRWGQGPWMTEPDRVEWRHKGVPCLIVRNQMGALCGYAAVAPGHKLHKVPYSRCGRWKRRKNKRECWKGYCGHSPESVLDVHGGITFADVCQPGTPICHIPQAGEPAEVWWFGFDCSHSGDHVPSMGEFWFMSGRETYKDVDYVKRETEELADQLLAYK